mmetsp:Transcript_30414/g.53444  ORF Transcript_30414/g.53444 Transcript_30414/m.53444 type:complete len:218 (+) Transcript_30414:621-1274(+)
MFWYARSAKDSIDCVKTSGMRAVRCVFKRSRKPAPPMPMSALSLAKRSKTSLASGWASSTRSSATSTGSRTRGASCWIRCIRSVALSMRAGSWGQRASQTTRKAARRTPGAMSPSRVRTAARSCDAFCGRRPLASPLTKRPMKSMTAERTRPESSVNPSFIASVMQRDVTKFMSEEQALERPCTTCRRTKTRGLLFSCPKSASSANRRALLSSASGL